MNCCAVEGNEAVTSKTCSWLYRCSGWEVSPVSSLWTICLELYWTIQARERGEWGLMLAALDWSDWGPLVSFLLQFNVLQLYLWSTCSDHTFSVD